MRIVCFAGAATVAVSTSDRPMARISQCVHIGCGRPQGEGTSSMKEIDFIRRKIIFWNYRNGTEGMDFQTYLLTLHRTFHSADIIKKHPQ